MGEVGTVGTTVTTTHLRMVSQLNGWKMKAFGKSHQKNKSTLSLLFFLLRNDDVAATGLSKRFYVGRNFHKMLCSKF